MEAVKVFSQLESSKDKFQNFLETLPVERRWYDTLYLYQGFWYPSALIKPTISFQQHFQALETDVILASIPKTGTTWLKALTFSILNRKRYPPMDNPLQTRNPHELVPHFELDLYHKSESPDLSDLPCPRIFATHAPYPSLPHSIKDSTCKIVYVCRNILDQLISYWHFICNLPRGNVEPCLPDELLEKYCQGVHAFGPFADHVLGYWQASLDRPEKVLFLKYEDMKHDINSQAKRLADFLGCPFSVEEDNQGVVQDICEFCSFKSLKNLEVNKTGTRNSGLGLPNRVFFRKGEVGNWKEHLNPSKAEYLENQIEEKLRGSGLTLKLSAGPMGDECKPSLEMDA